MLKAANTLELSDQDTSAEEVAPSADTGSEASIGLNQRQIDDLKRSLKTASAGIFDGKSLDLSSESASLLGDAMDAIVSPFLLSTPSRELERYIKNENSLFSSNKETNSAARKAFSQKIVSTSKRLYSAKFKGFIRVMEDLASKNILSLGASNDISNIKDMIADYQDKKDYKPILSSDSPYKVILNQMIPMLRQKFDAVVSFDESLGAGDRIDYENISRRIAEGVGESEDKAELVRFYQAIKEWYNILSLLDNGTASETPADEVNSQDSIEEASEESEGSPEGGSNISEDIYIESLRPGQYSHEDPTGSGSIYIDERIQDYLRTPVVKLYLRGRDRDLVNTSGSGEEYLSFLVNKGDVFFAGDYRDIIGEVTRESVSGGSELSLYFRPESISRLQDESDERLEIMRAEARRGIASVYVDDISQLTSLRRVASTETTVLYQAVSPNGELVSFTPTDLVVGGGKIKDSKGKSFKPTKRLRGKSLANRVMSKGYGKVRKK